MWVAFGRVRFGSGSTVSGVGDTVPPVSRVDREKPAGQDRVEDLVVVPEARGRVDDVVGVGVRRSSWSGRQVVSAAPFTVCGLQRNPTSLT